MAKSTETLYDRIKQVRTALKLPQREFAKRMYLSQSFFGEIETGKRPINERTIQLMVNQYKVNKDWLKTGKGNMFSKSMAEIRLEHFSEIFTDLDELLQEFLIKQAEDLLKIQKTGVKKK
jgi:transcriptional regulator with XRE-family HTH domain